MASNNIFNVRVTREALDTTLLEEHSAWQGLTKHHPSPPPTQAASAQQDTSTRNEQENAIQHQQSIFPYLDPHRIKKYATNRGAVFDAKRRAALDRVQQLSWRRDSGQGHAPIDKSASGPTAMVDEEDGVDLDDGQRLEAWRKHASAFLLQAAYARLGVGEGWKQYSPNTLLACRQLNEILTKGDPVIGLKVNPDFCNQLKAIKWWFTRATDAVDFLAWLSVFDDDKVFGSGTVRLDVVKHVNTKGACTEQSHDSSERWWANYNVTPPEDPCGCVQYKRILSLLAARTGADEPSDARMMVITEMDLRKHWQKENAGAAFLELKEWGTGEGNKAVEFRFRDGGVLSFKFWRRGGESGGEVKGMRIEGNLGEMLVGVGRSFV